MKKQSANTKLFSHIVMLSLVMIIAVTATFSWYNRTVSTDSKRGNVLSYSQSGNVKGEGGTIKTYVATTSKSRSITYDTELSEYSNVIETAPGATNYFKTEITSMTDSVISVYLENFSYAKSLGNGNVKIGINHPENGTTTYKNFSVTESDNAYKASRIYFEDNLKVRSGETIEIYWFVEVGSDTTSTGNITLGTMHLVYN